MDKKEIIRKVNAAPFSNDTILMHGASMVMHGVRKITGDIDSQLSLEKYPSLILTSKVCEDGVTRYEWEEFDFGDGKVRDIPYVTISGIKCQTLASIVDDKIQLGREKDFSAIDEINLFKKTD